MVNKKTEEIRKFNHKANATGTPENLDKAPDTEINDRHKMLVLNWNKILLLLNLSGKQSLSNLEKVLEKAISDMITKIVLPK